MLLAGAAGVSAWRFLLPKENRQTAVVATTAESPKAVLPASPSPTTAPPPIATPAKETAAAVVTPHVESERKPGKASKSCTPVEPTPACVPSEVGAPIQKSIMAALRDADVKLCPGERLTISGTEATLKVNHAPKTVPSSIQKDLVFSLRSHLHGVALPGEVEIRCKR